MIYDTPATLKISWRRGKQYTFLVTLWGRHNSLPSTTADNSRKLASFKQKSLNSTGSWQSWPTYWKITPFFGQWVVQKMKRRKLTHGFSSLWLTVSDGRTFLMLQGREAGAPTCTLTALLFLVRKMADWPPLSSPPNPFSGGENVSGVPTSKLGSGVQSPAMVRCENNASIYVNSK